MTFQPVLKISRVLALALFTSILLSHISVAQGPLPDSPTPTLTSSSPSAALMIAPSRGDVEHHFWDRQNRILFAANAAMSAADFAVTRANLRSGGQELNPVVRMFGTSTSGLAINFIGETAGVMSASYFFHKTGHHKLERAVSLVNIGASAGAVGYGLSHR